MSIFEAATTQPTKKRTNYRIGIQVGRFQFNEWGMSETNAKEIHEVLQLNNNEPLTIDGITFSRLKDNELSVAVAALKATLKPVDIKL